MAAAGKTKRNTKVKRARIRTLPLVICLCAVLFSLKLEALWENVRPDEERRPVITLATQAQAQKAEAAEPASESGEKTEKSEPETSPPLTVNYTPGNLAVTTLEDPDAVKFKQSEIEILQSLSKRREEIEAREKELEMKMATLNAAEMRIEAKLKQLQKLQEEINRLVGVYDEQEKDKLESLVKIYSNMKPKDAARIFNDLDMDILIKLFSQMKDSKAAAILAVMDSEKANALTVELANKNKPEFMQAR